jgi:hypothetical protein
MDSARHFISVMKIYAYKHLKADSSHCL